MGALANLATSGLTVTRWRWWLVAGIAFIGVIWALIEYVAARRGPSHTRDVVRPRWMLPKIDTPIERQSLIDALSGLLTGTGAPFVGVTTALYGAGGFGKTTLAVQVCALEEVRASFPGGLLWVTVGMERKKSDLAAIVNDLSAQLVGERPQFSDPEQAGRHLGQLLDALPRNLLVLDDIWTVDQLRPFMLGGARTTRLVTTRNPACLPSNAKTVRVDEMEFAESRGLIGRGLPPLPPEAVSQLLRLTGNWPLLLAMANGAIHGYVKDGTTPADAARMLAKQLASEGPAFLDVRIDAARDHAVSLTVAASVRLLPSRQRARYFELAIFAEDTDIPLDLLALLWGTAPTETRRLCADLADLSLVKAYRRGSATLQLHDVIRDHLRHEIDDRLPAVNAAFLAATRALLPSAAAGWWQLPDEAAYLWLHLSYHLAAARQDTDLKTLVCDLRWGEEKIRRFGLPAYESDLARIDDPAANVLRHTLARKGHLLSPIEPSHSHADLLVSRLRGVPELGAVVAAYAATLPRDVARLTNKWPIPPVDPALLRVLAGHTARVTGCAIAADSTWLATTSADHTTRIWNTDTWTERATLHGHTDTVTGCAIAPDSTWLATTSADHTTRIWNTDTWTERATLHGHTDTVTGCAIAPDSTWLATTSADHTTRIWNTATWTERATLHGHTDTVTGCAIAPDSTWLATTSADHTTRIWNTATWTERATLHGHTDTVTGCAIAPDSTWLATTSADHTTRIWNTATWTERATLHGHTDTVTGCAIAPDSTWLATTSADHTIRIWGTASWSERTRQRGHTAPVTRCAIAPDSTWLATTSADYTLRVWDTSSEYKRGTGYGQNRPVTSCAIAPNAAWLATASRDNVACVWDVETPVETETLQGHAAAVTGCAIAADGTWLATTSADHTTRIWNTATWTERATLHGHTDTVTGCAIAPDSTWLATTSADHTTRIWNTATWTERATLHGHTDTVTGCAIAPDSTWLATTSADHTTRIWNTDTWTERATLHGHTDTVTGCAIAPDSTWLATTSADHTTRIWNTATWTERATLHGHTDTVTGCAIAPDSTWLATTGADITLRIYDAAT